MPQPTAEFFGITDGLQRESNSSAAFEQRAACVYIQRVIDRRLRARQCFASVANPRPPPPPPLDGISSSQTEANYEEGQRVSGYRDIHPAAIPIDQDAYVLEAQAALADTKALIATLGNNNPVLRSFLGTAVSDLESEIVRTQDSAAARPTVTASGKYEPGSAGRRLLEREVEFPHSISSRMVDHPIQKTYRAGIPGLSRSACEAICEALAVTANNTDPESCSAFGFVRQNPFSLTDTNGRCYLLTSAGACMPEDFGAAMYTRQIMSERQCHAAAPGYDNPLCIQLSTTRIDTRVLSHSDAVDLAAQTPRDPAPGSGGLPSPRNALEAGSFVAFARRDGVYAFWAARVPNADSDVTTHWVAPDSKQLVVFKGDPRCILVSSTTSSTANAMYANLEPCSAKLADGIVTVAAQAAPPPPPGDTTTGIYDPRRAPPPPPSSRSIGWSIWKREVLKLETKAICSGAGGEGRVHRNLCQRVLNELARWQHVVGAGIVAPLCDKVCWHSCDGGNDAQIADSFNSCPQTECAQTSCYTFLISECPSSFYATIDSVFKSKCSVAPPSPPSPPRPPPSPPAPPQSPAPLAPPPPLNIVERLRDEELDSDPDCGLISIAQCSEVIRQFAARNGGEQRGYSRFMRVSTSHCEGLESETDCAIGCFYGTRTGGVYRFLPPEVPSSKFTRPRCRMSDHPRCACSPDSIRSPPPALYSPPPPVAFDADWNLFFPDFRTDHTIDTKYGTLGILHKRITNGRTLDLSLRDGPMHAIRCPRKDDGADTCGTVCAKHHLSRLRAYTVTGENFASPPPPPPDPSQPPAPPPPFVQTQDSSTVFNGCQTTCEYPEGETLCRDGGKGSFSPPICSYGTMCTLCSPRDIVLSTTEVFEGEDDSCPYANDGACQDGRSGSIFIRINSETSTHLCPYLTDKTDCTDPDANLPASTISTIDLSAFNTNPRAPFPLPPPPPPPSPPTPPPPLSECVYDCGWEGTEATWLGETSIQFQNGVTYIQTFCSDGGTNSYPYAFDTVTGEPLFACQYGHQCSSCSTRPAEVSDLCSDSCRTDVASNGILFKGKARNGICEDGGTRDAWMLIPGGNVSEGMSYHFKAGCGYGTDTLQILSF